MRHNTQPFVALGIMLVFSSLVSAELKVDLGPPGRPDIGAPHFIEWKFDPTVPSKNFDGVTITLRGGLEAGIYKFGIDYGARLACDGVFAKDGQMEMVVSGLTSGPHTIATFHNSLWPPDVRARKFNVFINGVLTLTNLQPTTQVTNDYDVTSAYARFTAIAGEDVTLKFLSEANIVLNGFEIDSG